MSPDLGPRLPDDDQVLLALLQRLDEQPCLPSHMLEGYIADALSSREVEHVHEHLRQCVVCVGALARLQSMRGAEPAPAPVAALRSTDSESTRLVAGGLIGRSAAFSALRDEVERVLSLFAGGRGLPNLLIIGETGTGKGFLADLLHRAGPRPDGPFVRVNCAAVPESLLEAELFGFERGAFTGARRSKPGLLQTANGGTICLDEVAEMPEALQAKLLKVLEERRVRRLGSTRDEPIDVWILSATNQDLQSASREGRFHEDLYQRLAELTLSLPPLRERDGDILMLAEHFLERARREHHLPPRHLDAGAQRALLAHRWLGNVRELAYTIERAALLAEGEAITARDLGIDRTFETRPLQSFRGMPHAALLPLVAGKPRASEIAEAKRLALALKSAAGDLSRAAALLKIPRSTLLHRLQKFGLLPKRDEPAP